MYSPYNFCAGHNSPMADTTHTPRVFFGPLVVQDHIRNGYLTTPTRFGDFPPVVESPYFLGVIPAVLPTTAKAHEAKLAKEEPQCGVSVQTWTPILIQASSDMDANFSDLHAQQSCKLLKQDHAWRPSTMPLTLSQRPETAAKFLRTEQ
ncbi:hypothetical protein Taro_004714 [Colocasia esculenta]|uniref:Uncharacterized protein n=1 Tax=Colocasia esculenta TaxID=4460 RepID=A0A843TMT9_COLES|nr:hypothetical protein [Colocasia esculenta]